MHSGPHTRLSVHLNQKPLVNTSRLVTNAIPNQGGILLTRQPANYLALAGGTMPFIRRYSTI
jgi:hypothetical protein